jgi:hypothetical protein
MGRRDGERRGWEEKERAERRAREREKYLKETKRY